MKNKNFDAYLKSVNQEPKILARRQSYDPAQDILAVISLISVLTLMFFLW